MKEGEDLPRLIINELGPIKHCDLEINDFMVFTGPQASGKSTIAKSVFFFKNMKHILWTLIRRKYLLNYIVLDMSVKNRLIREIRSNFMQIFGSTWCMSKTMTLEYYYTDTVYIKISLKDDPNNPNYIWIDFSEELIRRIGKFDRVFEKSLFMTNFDANKVIQHEINEIFADDAEVVYIPAGRSMITLLSTQLNYIYSTMDDVQKRNLDYCTQNYLERILQLKSFFTVSLNEMIRHKIELTDEKLDVDILKQCINLINDILQGEYRNIDGEERLQVSQDRYVKINFASSGQQESVWILNVLFYYILNNKKAYFIIEEPESHLFPNAQKLITEFISVVKGEGNQILLTTHSPYILGTINNLLYANRLSRMVASEEIDKIIGREKWLDFSRLTANYISNGKIIPCMDKEFEAIENEVIDGASEDINRDYEKMIALLEKSR